MRDMTLEEWLATGQDASTYYCRNRKTPIALGGLFTALLRQFYSDPANLYPGVRRYDPTGKCDQTVYIEVSNIWSDEKVDMRPAIIVDIGNMEMMSNHLQGIDKRSGFDLVEGESFYERLISTSVVFAHLAKLKGQAAIMASNTYDLLDAFSHVIKNDYCFDLFEARSILRPRMRRENPEDWESLVQFDIQFREGFSVKTESPKLKTISLDAVVR